MLNAKGKKQTRIDWSSHIDQFRISRLSRSEYTKLHGLNYNQFNYWYKKAESSNNSPESVRSVNIRERGFVELVSPAASSSGTPSRVNITTPDGLVVEFTQSWTPENTVSFLKLWSQK